MKYILIFASCLFSILVYIIFTNEVHSTDVPSVNVDSLKKANDSLYADLYPCEIELNRYRVALEIFLKRNPKAAQEYSTIISQETE